MSDLFFEVLSRRSMKPKAVGHEIFKIISAAPELTPETYGTSDPPRTVFDPLKLDRPLSLWKLGSPLRWQRKTPSMSGQVMLADGGEPHHGIITTRVDLAKVDPRLVRAIVQELAVFLRADFAFLHVPMPQDIEQRTAFMLPQVHLFISSKSLSRAVPNLFWGTWLGGPYIEHFRRECILSAPVAEVREIGDDLIYLQLTREISDLIKFPEQVEPVRRQAKEHLGATSFFDANRPEGPYTAPQFDWEARYREEAEAWKEQHHR